LNPIENLWGEIERALKGKEYKTKNELSEAVQELWSNLPRTKIESLIKSIPRRCQAILNAKGYATKY
jgi:transposase